MILSSIEKLQHLYRLFPQQGGDDPDFSLVEKSLRQTLGTEKAYFLFRDDKGLRTREGKSPLPPALQKKVLEHLSRRSQPWICQTKDRLSWVGFWPVAFMGDTVGCYALGKKRGQETFGAEAAGLMELLAERTGFFLERSRLWRCLEQEDRQSSLGFLSAAMIHEIRNPLSALSALAQLLPQKKGDANFMESFEKLMLRETDRLTDLTENFLGFLKPTQEKAARINLTGVMNQIIDLLKPLLGTRGMRLKVSNPEGLYLMGDERQIKSLILNLAKNALESAGRGGTVAVSTVWLSRLTYGPGPWVQLKVKNDGIGIPKENLKVIFAPYFSSKEKGAGLGLTICQKIVENHGGVIQAESTAHQTVFQAFLPALPKDPNKG